ncbi:unnamed protein product [Heligmosomoides polygyrus]|uniref:ATP-dependent Lon protease n=1 Tax=Heligmosomoides polygyrus TaxID=6339 RepID=A0A183GMB3_HELPZ|nr:unnamed protein product [Heligmosomoides polygyrus]
MSDQTPSDIVPEQRRPEQAPAAAEQEEDKDDIVGVFPPDFPIPIEPVLPVYEMRQKFDIILRAAEVDKEDVASKKHIKETLDEILERV